MKLATTTGDFFRYGYNDEQSISAVVEAGFKYIDYSFSYDFHNRQYSYRMQLTLFSLFQHIQKKKSTELVSQELRMGVEQTALIIC